MLYQITAYDVMGAVQLQVTTAEANKAGYGWTHRLMEALETGHLDSSEPWDVLWLIGQRLSEAAIERGGGATAPVR